MEMSMLYLILLRYQVGLDQVEAHIEGHRAWLRQHYSAGHFLLSGPLDPRTGGAILARAADRDTLDGWLRDDPFRTAGVADYQVIAWQPTLRAGEMPATAAPHAAAAS